MRHTVARLLPANNEALDESLQGAADCVNGDGQSLTTELLGTMSARVEGDELIIRFEDVPPGNHTFEKAAMRKRLRPLVCDDPDSRHVIDRGGRIRVEMISNIGTAAPTITISHC